jgi:parallel beta-helix repeat protein
VDGIRLFESSWNNIGEWNRIRSNANRGILLYSSSYNNIHENEIFNGGGGAFIQQVGIALYEHSENNTITKHRAPYTIFGLGIEVQDECGIVLQSSNNNVSDNWLKNNGIYGVAICGVPADNNTISKNRIEGSGTTGIWVCDCQNNKFLNNNITQNGYGIEFYHAYQMTVKYNNITQNLDAGVTITYGSTATLWSNNITCNKWGVYLFIAGSNNLLVLNNVTANSPSEGIVVHLTSDCWICYNWINLNNHGIYLIESSQDQIYGNFIDHNVNDGIRLESNSNNNGIHHNGISNSQNGIHESTSSSSPGNFYLFNSFSSNTVDMNLADSSLSLSDLSGKSEKGYADSSGDVVAGNIIANATCGIYIHGSSNFTIYNNNIADRKSTRLNSSHTT